MPRSPKPSAETRELDLRIFAAIESNDASRAEAAAEGKGTSALFAFARTLKGFPEFKNLDGLSAAQRLDATFLRNFPQDSKLHPINAAARAWESAFPECFDSRLEFIETFELVRIPGSELWESVFAAVRSRPLIPKVLYSEKHLFVVSIAGHLQKMRGEQTIWLPVKLLARLLHCDHATISRIRQRMLRDGFITKTREYDSRNADEFLFDLSLFDFTTGVQVRVAQTQPSEGCTPATPPRVAQMHTRIKQDSSGTTGENRKSQERETRGESESDPFLRSSGDFRSLRRIQ